MSSDQTNNSRRLKMILSTALTLLLAATVISYLVAIPLFIGSLALRGLLLVGTAAALVIGIAAMGKFIWERGKMMLDSKSAPESYSSTMTRVMQDLGVFNRPTQKNAQHAAHQSSNPLSWVANFLFGFQNNAPPEPTNADTTHRPGLYNN